MTVDEGEIIRGGRGEFQRGWNRGDERVRALALGAPLEYGERHKPRRCSECETDTPCRLDRIDDESAVAAYCERCNAETGRWFRGSMKGEVP